MYYSCYYYWEDELKGTPLSNFPLNLRRQLPFLLAPRHLPGGTCFPHVPLCSAVRLPHQTVCLPHQTVNSTVRLCISSPIRLWTLQPDCAPPPSDCELQHQTVRLPHQTVHLLHQTVRLPHQIVNSPRIRSRPDLVWSPVPIMEVKKEGGWDGFPSVRILLL